MLPVCTTLDLTPAGTTFNTVKEAIREHDYDRAINDASATIGQIQQKTLIAVLDHRAYAYGMKGQLENAVKDAQTMIQYGPTLSAGYLRLASVFDMQGKRLKVADTCDAGLRNVSMDDPEYGRLVARKKNAMRDRYVDVIGLLPHELSDNIIIRLSNRDKSACLAVCITWREKILNSSTVWADSTNNGDPEANDLFASVMPYIAPHVQQLTISTRNTQVWFRYLRHLEDGSFSKLSLLQILETASEQLNPNMLMDTTNALWQMRNTLRELEIDFGVNHIAIKLVDLLLYCPYLKTLIVTAESPFPALIGSINLLEKHQHLINLDICAKHISGEVIAPLLVRCEQLRRLALNKCSSTNVITSVDNSCPNLGVFGYNSNYSLLDLIKYDTNGEHRAKGLRVLYTNHGGYGVSSQQLFRQIQKHMFTLKRLLINISRTQQQGAMRRRGPDPNFAVDYEDLMLRSLEWIVYWADSSSGPAQQLLLQAISKCTRLKSFGAVNSPDIRPIVKQLMNLPPLKTLKLSHIKVADGDPGLMQLLSKYASISLSKPSLEKICFRNCTNVTDAIIGVLADINTLKQIRLVRLENISADGIGAFLKRLDSNVSYVQLKGMSCILDQHLAALGYLKGLNKVQLEELQNVTNHGIMDLVDNAEALHSLIISKCMSTTHTAVLYARQKVSSVNYYLTKEYCTI